MSEVFQNAKGLRKIRVAVSRAQFCSRGISVRYDLLMWRMSRMTIHVCVTINVKGFTHNEKNQGKFMDFL